MLKHRRVLVVDDEPQIQRFLKPSLSASSFDVTQATTGREAIMAFESGAPELVLLDLGLPDMDGKDVIAAIRAKSDVPIIVLSARDQELEKVVALDMGANDYVSKPFGIGELLARVRAVLRNRVAPPSEAEVLVAPPIVMDLRAHRAEVRETVVRLTPKEFDFLAFLARHPDRVLTHRQILKEVWGPAHTEDLQYLRVLVGQLRRKIEIDPAAPSVLITEPGVGYRLVMAGQADNGSPASSESG
jgi:two-component system KDP operon response regulator KdpE